MKEGKFRWTRTDAPMSVQMDRKDRICIIMSSADEMIELLQRRRSELSRVSEVHMGASAHFLTKETVLLCHGHGP